MRMPSHLTIAKYVALLLLIVWAAAATKQAFSLNAEVVRIVDAIRVASQNRELERGDAAEQVQAMGQSLRTLNASLARCSASVKALSETGASQRAAADTVLARSQSVLDEAAKATRRLEASARAPAAGACLSNEVKRRWK